MARACFTEVKHLRFETVCARVGNEDGQIAWYGEPAYRVDGKISGTARVTGDGGVEEGRIGGVQANDWVGVDAVGTEEIG